MSKSKRFDPVEVFHSPIAKAWFWRLKAKNGRVVADSGEGYSSEAKARQGLSAAGRLIINAVSAAGKRVTRKTSKGKSQK